MAPTLSSVRNYDPHWLLDDAAHSRRTANGWTDGWQTAYQNVAAIPWTGIGREAALATHRSGLTQASTHAATLTASAAGAEQAYHELINEKQAILRQVDEIQGEGYQVAESFTVLPGPRMKGAEIVLRAPDMAQKTAALTEAAGQLFAHDAAAGAQVAAPVATFADAPMSVAHGGIQLVDRATPIPDPGDLGSIAPPDMPDSSTPFLDRYQASIGATPPQTGEPVAPMPTSRPPNVPKGVPLPPVMTKPPPNDGVFEPGPDPGFTEENPKTGPVLGAAVMGGTLGCETGAGWAAALSAPVIPAEGIAVPVGCATGAVIGAAPPLLYPWVDNLLEGGG
jgi:hypothetical protein